MSAPYKTKILPGSVVEICNLSYLRGGDQEKPSVRSAWAKKVNET
jgi:hypothetical protein